jgi:equilibrative nucleoside transporter 1/2/3
MYGDSFVFFISLAFNWSGALCFAVLMKMLPKFSFTSRVMTSLAIFFVVLIIIPFLHGTPEKISITVTLIGVFLTGFASSVMQSTIAGLAALFPPEYIGGMMSGCGIAGIVAIVLRIITKVALPQTPAGLQASGKLFFILAAGIVALCAGGFIVLMRLSITQHNLTKYYKLKSTDTVLEPQEATIAGIIRKIWKEALAIIISFFVTLSLFPGITSLVKSNSNLLKPDWFSILFTALFMLGDFVGRTAPRWFRIFSPKILLVPTLVRFAFFPLLLFCIKPHLIREDWISCTLSFLFSLSNGYISTLGMIYGPQKVASYEKELAGIILAGCITAGIVLGSHFAFLMLYLVTGNIGVKF